ncbi:MAG TPA: hypothetical protein PLY93_00440 [Turneriella sp.]|nr:hypothetical protein [Turneriella sp.]
MKKIVIVLVGLFLVSSLSAVDDALAIARREIGVQFDLLKKGKTTQLKTHFTDRQKARVVDMRVKRAQKETAQYKITDLVHSAQEISHNGRRTIKVKMRNERTLTTLVEIDGKWYADTVWFK